jgi:hypothetical protein
LIKRGFFPSYVLESDIGKKISKLKQMEKGWLYPTYLYQYLSNPAPLLLYDEIYVDNKASEELLKHKFIRNPNTSYEKSSTPKNLSDTEVNLMSSLLSSKIVNKVDIDSKLNSTDYDSIETEYYEDINSKNFIDSLSTIKTRYGDKYARPNPTSFEAMNINLTNTISSKLNSTPIDDILRYPIYDYKNQKHYNKNRTSRQIFQGLKTALMMPSEKIYDIDEFLDLHKDNVISTFRKKVSELETKNYTQEEFSRVMQRENDKLKELTESKESMIFSIVGAFTFLGISVSTPSMFTFACGTIGVFADIYLLIKEARKADARAERVWLEQMKGFLEP